MNILKNIILLCIISFFLAGCENKDTKTVEEISVDAIPVGTMAICRVKNPQSAAEILEKNMYLQALDSMKTKNILTNGVRLTSAICSGKNSTSAPMTIAVGAVRAKELSFIYMVETGKTNPRTSFGADTTVTSRVYENSTIYTVSIPSIQIHYYTTGGMTVASTDELYLEQSLLQTSSGISIATDASFTSAYERLKSGDGLTAIINLPQLSHFTSSQLGFAEFGLLGQMSPWMSAEIEADSTTISLSGTFCASDSIKTYAKVLSSQKSKEMTLDAFFPSNTSVYTYLGIEDWKKYFKENIQYLKASSQYHLYNVALQRYNTFFGTDFEKFFTPWIGKGVAVVRSTGTAYSDTQNSVFIGVKDHDEAMAALEKIADSITLCPDPYLDHRIITLGQKNIFSDIISSALGKKGVNYATVAGDVLICSYELPTLKNILDDIKDGTTLTSIGEYREQKATLPTTTHMMTMVRGDMWAKDMLLTIKEKRKTFPIVLSEVEKYIFANSKDFTALRYNFFQTSSTGSVPFMNFKGIWSSSVPREASKGWSFSMENSPAAQTIAFPNHRVGGYDVLCANTKGMLYLISEKGTLYWKKKLPAAVSSPFVVVDLYKNKKYQMAFYAGKKFYVIDRNGNPVTNKDKIALAKKATKKIPSAKVISSDKVQIKKGGNDITVKTPQSPVACAEYISDFDAVVYSTTEGKIYACTSKGSALKGFPLPQAQYFAAADFGKNKKMSIVTTSTSGLITMYRIPENN